MYAAPHHLFAVEKPVSLFETFKSHVPHLPFPILAVCLVLLSAIRRIQSWMLYLIDEEEWNNQ